MEKKVSGQSNFSVDIDVESLGLTLNTSQIVDAGIEAYRLVVIVLSKRA